MGNLADDLAEYERCPPAELEGDPIWRLPAYSIGSFLADVARADCVVLRRVPQGLERADQLLTAVEAIPANITEGYGRSSGKDRARFYEIALSSAREARDWYRRVRDLLGPDDTLRRTMLLTRVIKILTAAIPQERAGASEERIRRAVERTRRHPETRSPPASHAHEPGTSSEPSDEHA